MSGNPAPAVSALRSGDRSTSYHAERVNFVAHA
jgi:hypothetical protein